MSGEHRIVMPERDLRHAKIVAVTRALVLLDPCRTVGLPGQPSRHECRWCGAIDPGSGFVTHAKSCVWLLACELLRELEGRSL